MPPRRSIGRPTGATPARSTRASSAISILTSDTPVTRRSTRQATLQSGSQSSEGSRVRATGRSTRQDAHLPDVHGQQSYAYGANKGLTIPAKLGTANRKSIHAMAGDIEEEFEEEDETKELEPSSDAEASHLSDLSEIPEESDQENDQSSEISQPSQFPSSIADHSYNYERGIRRIRTGNAQPIPPGPFTPINKISQSTRNTASRIATSVSQTRQRLGKNFKDSTFVLRRTVWEICDTGVRHLRRVPMSSIAAILSVLFAVVFAMGMLGATVCFFYGRIGCSMIPSSGFGIHIHTSLQTLCGECVTASTTFDLTDTSSQDLTKLSTTLANIHKKIQDLERRLTYRMDTNHASLESDLNNLKQQHTALSNHLADHVDQDDGNGGNVASPLIPKINFFSPSNGLTVNLHRTSPTKIKEPRFPIKHLKWFFWYNYHNVNRPLQALTPWQDIGDCWCAADLSKSGLGQDYIRLAVATKEMIYPTELVIEHYPSSGNPNPASTPRHIELWAEFSHLNEDEWNLLKLGDLQQGNVLGPRYARLGRMEYDATGGASHVQTGALNVNQFGLLYYAQRYVLRVTSNYGGKNACLYRVRLHGQPVAAPEAGNTEEWYEKQGYRLNETDPR